MLSSCQTRELMSHFWQALRRSRQPTSSLRRCVGEGEAASLKRTRFLEPVEQSQLVGDLSQRDEEPAESDPTAASASLDCQPISSCATEEGNPIEKGATPLAGASSPFASQQAQEAPIVRQLQEATPIAGEQLAV